MTEPTQPNEQGQPGVPARPVRRARPEKQPAKQDRTTLILLLIAAFVAVGGVGFALGHLTAPGAAAANANGRTGGFAGRGAFGSLAPGETLNPGAFGGRGLGSVAGGVSGTVQSITSTSVTIEEASGTTVTINLDGTTTYHSAAAASTSDVKVGSSVTVQIDTSALASQTPDPNATGALGGRTLTAKDVLITNP